MLHKLKKLTWIDYLAIVVLTFGALMIVIPFWSAIVISLQSQMDYARHPFTFWPTEVTLDNYKMLFKDIDEIGRAYGYTIYMTAVGTVAGMTLTTMASYAFSRPFPGRRFLFKVFLFTMYFGGGLVPVYMLMKNLHLLNTLYCTILLSLVSVYNMIVMRNGFLSVPMELQESAMIDGATDIRIFVSVMLPLQKPLLATFSLFTVVGYWNTWYWPMISLTKGGVTVLQLYLKRTIEYADMMKQAASAAAQMQNSYSMGLKMASVFIVMAPIMILYPFLQKYFTKGIMVGAVKM